MGEINLNGTWVKTMHWRRALRLVCGGVAVLIAAASAGEAAAGSARVYCPSTALRCEVRAPRVYVAAYYRLPYRYRRPLRVGGVVLVCAARCPEAALPAVEQPPLAPEPVLIRNPYADSEAGEIPGIQPLRIRNPYVDEADDPPAEPSPSDEPSPIDEPRSDEPVPTEEPPAEELPVEEPFAEESAADEPPADEPPAEEPPAEEPPAEEPPAEESAADEPLAEEPPPTDEALGDESPPAEEPPADDAPPAEPSPEGPSPPDVPAVPESDPVEDAP